MRLIQSDYNLKLIIGVIGHEDFISIVLNLVITEKNQGFLQD